MGDRGRGFWRGRCGSDRPRDVARPPPPARCPASRLRQRWRWHERAAARVDQPATRRCDGTKHPPGLFRGITRAVLDVDRHGELSGKPWTRPLPRTTTDTGSPVEARSLKGRCRRAQIFGRSRGLLPSCPPWSSATRCNRRLAQVPQPGNCRGWTPRLTPAGNPFQKTVRYFPRTERAPVGRLSSSRQASLRMVHLVLDRVGVCS